MQGEHTFSDRRAVNQVTVYVGVLSTTCMLRINVATTAAWMIVRLHVRYIHACIW